MFACCSSTADTLMTTRDLLVTHDPGRGLGVSNWGRYTNSRLDRPVEQGLTLFDPHEHRIAAERAANIIAKEVPLILLYQPFDTWAARAPATCVARQDGQSPVTGARRGP